MNLKIKICGMKDPDNIRLVAELKPDYMGFIFYSGSPRHYSGTVDPFIHMNAQETGKIGVFVNEPIDSVLNKAERFHLDMIQLHGNETPAYCYHIKKEGLPIVKAIRIFKEKDLNNLGIYEDTCDYFLFDTGGQTFGGTGKKFNWEILDTYKMSIPFFLGGGIGPGDTGMIKGLDLPGLFALDINSRFEISPGIKNIPLIKTFIKSIKQLR